jgi:2-iminobutanoate/2-iminopropanoate deaminase
MRALLLLLVSSLAMSTQTPNKTIVTVGTAPSFPYSQAVKAGGLIYLAGVVAQDEAGAIAPKGDIKGQTTRVIERMRAVLAAAGSSLDQVEVRKRFRGDERGLQRVLDERPADADDGCSRLRRA